MEGNVGSLKTMGLGFGDFETSAQTGFDNPFENLTLPSYSRVKQIWAVGGGKGGVGKSLIASSLAITLTRQGHRVIAIDLDLGCANLHTTLGLDLPKQTLSDFVQGHTTNLNQCVASTPIFNLGIISGAQDSVGVVEITTAQKSRIIQQARELDADYVIFDLGAGTNNYTLDFFLASDIGTVTLVPEPTSIENAYRFIKSAYFRRLLLAKSLKSVHSVIERGLNPQNQGPIKCPSELFQEISRTNPEAAMRMKEEISKFKPKLIVNQTRTQADIEIGHSVKTVCKKYFGADMDYLGHLDYDSEVWQAVRRKRPLILEFPNSRFVSNVEKIVQGTLKNNANDRFQLF